MIYRTHILRISSILIVLSILLSEVMISQEQGKIRGFDDEAKSEKKDSIPSVQTPSNDTFGGSDGLDFVAETIGYIVIGALVQFPGEDSSVHNNTFWTRGFNDYPYSKPEQGIFSLNSNKKFSFSFSGHWLNHGNNLTGYSGRLFVSPHQAFNLEAQVVDLSEKLRTKTDHLRFYNFFIDYNRVKSERFLLWWGLGIKGMNGPTVNTTGFALNSGFILFPFAPVGISMNYNVGFINRNSLQELLCMGNWYISRYNLLFGYQRFTVGNAVLDGMIIGLSAHF